MLPANGSSRHRSVRAAWALVFCLAGIVGCEKSQPAISANVPKPAPAAGQAIVPAAPKPLPLVKHSDEVKTAKKRGRESMRDADFEELMTSVLSKRLGGEQAMKAACEDSGKQGPVEVEDRIFGDLDGDGYEDAAVTAFSCQAGQSPPDLLAVFKQTDSANIVELPLDDMGNASKFAGEDILDNLRGPWRIEIDKGELVVRYLIWAPDAPKCGDADCTTDFIYR
jgi:hypothetical protein